MVLNSDPESELRYVYSHVSECGTNRILKDARKSLSIPKLPIYGHDGWQLCREELNRLCVYMHMYYSTVLLFRILV